MAIRAIQKTSHIDVIGDQKLLSSRDLVRGRLPIHVEDAFAGTNVILRLSMAIDTPLHLQRLRSPHQWHLIDLTVTRGATYALRHMNAVIEINKVRQFVNADPMKGFVLLKTDEYRRENSLVSKQL